MRSLPRGESSAGANGLRRWQSACAIFARMDFTSGSPPKAKSSESARSSGSWRKLSALEKAGIKGALMPYPCGPGNQRLSSPTKRQERSLKPVGFRDTVRIPKVLGHACSLAGLNSVAKAGVVQIRVVTLSAKLLMCAHGSKGNGL